MKKKDTTELKFISKEIKRNKDVNEDYKKMVSFFVVLAIVGIFIGLLFFINAKFVTKDLFQEDEEETTTKEAKYDDSLLIVSDILKQSGEYYVLAYDSKDENTSIIYDSLVTSYSNEDIKLYTVDLSLKMNSGSYDPKKEESIKKDEFNFIQATLITVKNNKIIKYTTDRDEIIKLLNK